MTVDLQTLKPFGRYERKVAFAETDAAGIVHFTHYMCWMEEAEHAFLSRLGIPLFYEDAGVSYGWPRVHAESKYMRPMFFEDWMAVDGVGLQVKGSRLTFHFEIFRRISGGLEKAAAGKLQTTFARIERGALGKVNVTPALLPEKVLKILQPWA
jgi:acyl-CoA thioester hydrolase